MTNILHLGEMNFWVNEKLKKILKEHADRLRKSLVGKTGPNLIMQDSNFKPRSMYDIKNKYTILLFLIPTAGTAKPKHQNLFHFTIRKSLTWKCML